MTPRMREKFENEVAPKAGEQFGVANNHALPKLAKIVINVGMGKELEGSKVRAHVRDQVLDDLRRISGQKPVLLKARKSVANFKVREGWDTHAKVTLRGNRMWEFFDRLMSLAIPRVKDFRGLPTANFDAAGNYSIGLQEQGVFPEINMAEAQYTHGMNINFVFENSDPERSRFVLTEMGVPFKKDDED